MNDNKKQLEEWAKLDTDSIDFDDLESKLDSELEEQMADLEGLEADREKIGNPDTIGHTVMNVVWEQFINQVGVVAGEVKLLVSEAVVPGKDFVDSRFF